MTAAFASLIRGITSRHRPWQEAPRSAPHGKRIRNLAPGVFLLRTREWVHAAVLDTHANLPEVSVGEVDPHREWPIPEWHEWALCGGMDFATFFGAVNDERPTMKRSEISAARRICSACPVKRECLQWALGTGEDFGVWGGTSGRQRARMRAVMKAGASQDEVIEGWFSRWLETT